jgi:hypothetical protein
VIKIKITPHSYGLLSVKFSCADQDSFFEAVESFKGQLYENERKYDADGRRWIVKDCDSFEFWIEYARENLAADVEDSRNRYRQQHRQARREEYRPPQRPQKVDQLSQAFETLHLRESAPLCVIKAVRKALATQYHPDKGGDLKQMQVINSAADLLEKRLGGPF